MYILSSEKTNRFYIGQTSDFDARFKGHNAGYNKSTKHGIPWTVYFVHKLDSRSEALKLERTLKNLKSHTRLEAYIDKLKS